MGEFEKVTLELVVNPDADLHDRVQGIRALQWTQSKEKTQALISLLGPTVSDELQLAALDTLATSIILAADDTLALILSKWSALSPRVRSSAAALFLQGPSGREMLRQAIKSKQIFVRDLTPEQLKLASLGGRDPEIAALIQAEFKERHEVLAAYRETLNLSGDKTRGAEHFKKQCSACHKLGDVGKEIGPNLAAMKNRGAEAILVNVLDPNREVNPQFVTYTVVTKDGRTLSGMIAAETATSITLRRGEGLEDTVLRIDIEELRSTGMSLMPEGLEKQLNQQQLADVIAFILGQ